MESGLRRSIILVLFGSFVLLNLATYLILRSRPPEIGWGREEPVIPSYPAAIDEFRQKAEPLGYQSLTFRVTQDYPSTEVLDYYTNMLESLDYRPFRPEYKPSWRPEDPKENSRRLVLSQFWVDPEGLRLLQLDISTIEEFETESVTERIVDSRVLPGQKVELTMSRQVFLKYPEEDESEEITFP